MLYGWLFGFWQALVVVSFASTTGATIAFLLSRYLFGQAIQARYGQRVAAFNAAIEREGAFYLFTLRLIPQVPFFVINVVMGLTKLRHAHLLVGQPTRHVARPRSCSCWPGRASRACANPGARPVEPSRLEARHGLGSLGVVPLAIKRLLASLRPAASSPADTQ